MSMADKAPGFLAERLRLGRFPNALILTGGGRDEMAAWLTMAYLCETQPVPCGHCSHCRKVQAGIHPDFTRVGREGENVKVDEVREIRRDAFIRPNEAARKVYHLKADGLNTSGQNVLLKLLEEGPPYAAFFLDCEAPEALLPTVRSRCEIVQWQGELEMHEISALAQEFTVLLQKETPGLALAEFLVSLEAKKREELRALLDEVRVLLLPEAQKREKTALLLPRLDALGEVRAACQSNISPGHIAGMLMAKLL